ncbi:DNA polymerase alpha subunit B isoform X2 [Camellia sinensis]|uniref:DNA polymerase alpha subunit B isoform X2 n=1 Tax=Camellia sinensis TaxID=4442 RepID=UPI00103686B5|nr:DNA polymerase alpha subunit B isoform X2 [Camellia sinensis]
MEEEIKAEFKKNGFNLDEEEEILKKCLTFCIQYKLSPADLVSSWDVYSLNRQLELTVQNAHMDAFLLQLQNEQKEAIIKKESGLHLYSNDVAMLLSDEHEDTKEGFLGTPTDRSDTLGAEPFDSIHKINGETFSSIKPLESVTPFGQRKSKFVVQSTLNDLPNVENVKKEHDHQISEDDIIKRVQPSSRCSLVIHGSQPEPGCRFMYDKIEDKFNFLENRIRKHATALVASGLFEEPIDPTVASQKSVFAVGMICCEEEGRLKEKPVLLQSSVEHSGGQRVRLDLQKLSQFSIFPGQVVGVEGHNPSGHCLTASKIIDYTPWSGSADENPHPTKKQVVDQEFQLTDPSHVLAELSMIIAAGPFTTTDNLFFEPLTELLAYARRKQPQLLLLLGPFIDSEHPEIKKGAVNRTFDEIFRLEILGRPAFDIQQADLKHQITSLTNPGIFSANEVRLGCCTVDILRQLSGEEISRNPSGGSKQRMNRLANHLLSQRSFYPLYPPMEDTPVDFSLAPEALQIPCNPDVLILSSDLAHFVKVLSIGDKNDGEEQAKCICVNPGRLARGEGAGFFVELNYGGSPDSTSASVISI